MIGTVLKILSSIFSKDTKKKTLTMAEIAKLLNTNEKAYEAFENAYRVYALERAEPDNFNAAFSTSLQQLTAGHSKDYTIDESLKVIIDKTVKELLSQASVLRVKNNKLVTEDFVPALTGYNAPHLTPRDISTVPLDSAPQLLGDYMVVHNPIGSAAPAIFFHYKQYLKEKNEEKKTKAYLRFRQGLDILDLEPITYELLKYDPNSMGKWLPALTKANSTQNFFKIPDTTVVQVPITLLQMSRLDYLNLTHTTLKIADEFCKAVFELDEEKEYFIKTGTFSSKFDFRNARVKGAKEVNEIGEYLIFLSNTAVELASPLSRPSIIGASTNNEWVVREYIHDSEGNPCIYKGLPLHTEYRVFVDCDTKQVLGTFDYWDRDLLKKRFSENDDANSPHSIHDYIIIQKHQETMDKRFNTNRSLVEEEVAKILPCLNLKGQWSIDVMQNRKDFYLIDMGLAVSSALKEKLPDGLITPLADERVPQLHI